MRSRPLTTTATSSSTRAFSPDEIALAASTGRGCPSTARTRLAPDPGGSGPATTIAVRDEARIYGWLVGQFLATLLIGLSRIGGASALLRSSRRRARAALPARARRPVYPGRGPVHPRRPEPVSPRRARVPGTRRGARRRDGAGLGREAVARGPSTSPSRASPGWAALTPAVAGRMLRHLLDQRSAPQTLSRSRPGVSVRRPCPCPRSESRVSVRRTKTVATGPTRTAPRMPSEAYPRLASSTPEPRLASAAVLQISASATPCTRARSASEDVAGQHRGTRDEAEVPAAAEQGQRGSRTTSFAGGAVAERTPANGKMTVPAAPARIGPKRSVSFPETGASVNIPTRAPCHEPTAWSEW